jgi:hypothetical protein
MSKNFQIHLRIETEVIDRLKKEADEEGISLGELCRQKLRQNSKLERIESAIDEFRTLINTQLNHNRRYKMVTKLPEFKGYTVDERLKQFRKVDRKKPSIDFVDFDSEEGQELLAQYEESKEE